MVFSQYRQQFKNRCSFCLPYAFCANQKDAVGNQLMGNGQELKNNCFFCHPFSFLPFACDYHISMTRGKFCRRVLKVSIETILAPVVRKVDSAIHWIAQLVVVILNPWIAIYSVDSAIQLSNNRGQKFSLKSSCRFNVISRLCARNLFTFL